jgi:hypothetical protein
MGKSLNLADEPTAPIEALTDLVVGLALEPQGEDTLLQRSERTILPTTAARDLGPSDEPFYEPGASLDPGGDLVDLDPFPLHLENETFNRPEAIDG